MSKHHSKTSTRIGRVTVFERRGKWGVYFRLNGQPIRRTVSDESWAAQYAASLINSFLIAMDAPGSPPPLPKGLLALFGTTAKAVLCHIQPSAKPEVDNFDDDPNRGGITVSELRDKFLDHHEHVLGSTTSTISRYGSATLHLVNFTKASGIDQALDVEVADFVGYLRRIEVSPNGHAHTAKRPLRDKGIIFILETCRSMYRFGITSNALPKDSTNPFTAFGIGKLRIRDAKPCYVFTQEQELAFLKACDAWSLAVFFTLAKTGLRPGELAHLLIEDLDLSAGWLHVRNKPDLGWSIKTGLERKVPLVSQLVELLMVVIGSRPKGPVFLRAKLSRGLAPKLCGDHQALATEARRRLVEASQREDFTLTRKDETRIYASVWRDAGAIPIDRIRTTYMRITKRVGIADTCPKSWRHTFATLLQEANVDPLIRQLTLGHKPTASNASPLGMTTAYTHTSPQLQHQQIERAMQLRSRSLELVHSLISQGDSHHD